MAFKVRFTITRASTNVDWVENVGMQNTSDIGLVDTYLADNGGSKETSTDGLSATVIYNLPDQASWQAFYNQALPVWNRNNVLNRANDAGITVDVEVLENT